MESHNSPRRLLLVSVPRTASNLLLKILNIPGQPNAFAADRGGYFFYNAFHAVAKDGRLTQAPSEWTDEAKHEVQSTFQECFDHLEETCALAERENKTMFAKEHSFWLSNPMAFMQAIHGPEKGPYDFSTFHVNVPSTYGTTRTFSTNNKTVLPDEYLRTWTMAFIIRHPAIVFPSFCRAMNKISDMGVMDTKILPGTLLTNMTLHWTRSLFDWSLKQTGSTPLLLDAYDVVHNPDAITKFCQLAGLDPSKLQFQWESGVHADSVARPNGASQGVFDWDTGKSVMLSTLNESSGVMKSKEPAVVDIPTEVKKWQLEFGEEMAQLIEKAVSDAMPDYEYLRARRVTV